MLSFTWTVRGDMDEGVFDVIVTVPPVALAVNAPLAAVFRAAASLPAIFCGVLSFPHIAVAVTLPTAASTDPLS